MPRLNLIELCVVPIKFDQLIMRTADSLWLMIIAILPSASCLNFPNTSLCLCIQRAGANASSVFDCSYDVQAEPNDWFSLDYATYILQRSQSLSLRHPLIIASIQTETYSGFSALSHVSIVKNILECGIGNFS